MLDAKNRESYTGITGDGLLVIVVVEEEEGDAGVVLV